MPKREMRGEERMRCEMVEEWALVKLRKRQLCYYVTMAMALENSMSIDQMQEDFASHFSIHIQFMAPNVLRIDLSTCRNHSIEHFYSSKMQTSSAAAVWWLFKRCSSVKTQQVRCMCEAHTSRLMWNSIPMHAKMMSVLANKFIESKRGFKWSAMSIWYERLIWVVCVCSRANVPYIWSLHIISILKGRRTYIYTEVANTQNSTFASSRSLALPPSAKQIHKRTPIESICFRLMTQLCFATAFTWDPLTTKRQLNCNQYAAERTIQNDMQKLQSNICILRKRAKLPLWN